MLCLLKKTTSHGFQYPCESSLSEAFKDVILVNTKRQDTELFLSISRH